MALGVQGWWCPDNYFRDEETFIWRLFYNQWDSAVTGRNYIMIWSFWRMWKLLTRTKMLYLPSLTTLVLQNSCLLKLATNFWHASHLGRWSTSSSYLLLHLNPAPPPLWFYHRRSLVQMSSQDQQSFRPPSSSPLPLSTPHSLPCHSLPPPLPQICPPHLPGFC